MVSLFILLLSMNAFAQHDPEAVTPLSQIAAIMAPGEQRESLRGLEKPAGTEDCDDEKVDRSKDPYVEVPPFLVKDGKVILPTNTAVRDDGVIMAYGPVTVIDEPGTAQMLQSQQRGDPSAQSVTLNYSVLDPRTQTESAVSVKGSKLRYQEQFRLGDSSEARFRVELDARGRAMLSLKVTR